MMKALVEIATMPPWAEEAYKKTAAINFKPSLSSIALHNDRIKLKTYNISLYPP